SGGVGSGWGCGGGGVGGREGGRMEGAVDPADARLGGLAPHAVPTDRAVAMTVEGEDALLFKNVFPRTPSGKVELVSTYLGNRYGAPLPRFRAYESPYPLSLITPASDQRTT